MGQISKEDKQSIATVLQKYGILQFGQFTLKSGIVSPFYIDMRMLQSYPEALHTVAKVYAKMMEDLSADTFLAGIPEAGIPLATAVGYESNRPLIQPRAKLKEHGKGKAIEGDWKPGDTVAIIDDLITKGDSKIEALEQFKSCDLNVSGFYLLIDREMGGIRIVEDAGYSVRIAVTMTEIFDMLLETGGISSEQHDDMIAFMRS